MGFCSCGNDCWLGRRFSSLLVVGNIGNRTFTARIACGGSCAANGTTNSGCSRRSSGSGIYCSRVRTVGVGDSIGSNRTIPGSKCAMSGWHSSRAVIHNLNRSCFVVRRNKPTRWRLASTVSIWTGGINSNRNVYSM